MTVTKLTLAALFLGASFVPALAETGYPSQSPQEVYLSSLAAKPAEKPMIEGRQAAPIHATAPETAAERYVVDRNFNPNH